MGFMEKLGATLATKYGVVTAGKYAGCQIALGNPPDKKVSVSYSFDQIIFVMEKEEQGRFSIEKDVRCFHVLNDDDQGVHMQLLFENEDYCEFILRFTPAENAVVKTLKAFGGGKTGPQTPEQKFHNMIVFFRNAFVKMLSSDILFFEKYFGDNGVLDDLTKTLIDKYKEAFAEVNGNQ